MKLKSEVASLLLVLLTGCESVDVAIQPHEEEAELVALALAVHQQVNDHRAAKKLPALKMDARLSRIARRKSAAMAQGGAFDHTGFRLIRSRQIRQVIPYSHVGENLAYNSNATDPAARAVQMWLDSPGHLRNMEHPEFRVTGIAVAKSADGRIFFTQLFVCPR